MKSNKVLIITSMCMLTATIIMGIKEGLIIGLISFLGVSAFILVMLMLPYIATLPIQLDVHKEIAEKVKIKQIIEEYKKEKKK